MKPRRAGDEDHQHHTQFNSGALSPLAMLFADKSGGRERRLIAFSPVISPF